MFKIGFSGIPPTFELETLNFKPNFQAAKVMESGLQVQSLQQIVEKLRRVFQQEVTPALSAKWTDFLIFIPTKLYYAFN